ncbi:MAG: hypothetical protein JXA64_04535 [Candidatus Fermentibacteraceae bacterium]|nr:hypothetical protein [Candidatus Fermentibacteraceae bacterium]MBN2608361.1 hypothetical protein [Candidatus Fermentibacteraceae bacterium]
MKTTLLLLAVSALTLSAQSCPGGGGSTGCGSCTDREVLYPGSVATRMGPVTVVPEGIGVHINGVLEDEDSPEVTVSFSVEDSSFVSVGLTDMAGEPLILITDGFYDPGNYRATFSAGELEPGIYILRVDALGGYAFATIYLFR